MFTGGAKRTAARVGNTDQVNICIKRKTDCQSWTKSKLEATKHAVSRMCYVNSCHCGQIRDSEDNDETDCSANNADEIGLQGSRFFFKKQENELVEHILAMDSILRHYATGQVFGPTPGAASDSYSVPLPEFRFRSRTSFQHHLRTSFRSRFWTSYQTRYRTS